MSKLKSSSIGAALLLLLTGAHAAVSAEQHAASVMQADHYDTSRPLRDIIEEMGPTEVFVGPAREVPNIFPKSQSRSNTWPEVEALRSLGQQTTPSGTPAPTISVSFDGLNINESGGSIPPDTNGDVSPSHYIQWVNTRWTIIDKVTGTKTAGVPGRSFWAGFGGSCQTRNDGDPIVLWDDRAERWVMSQFVTTAPFAQCFAISTTSDPLGTYHRYQFTFPVFGDYPHIGVWTDGGTQSAYLLTTHDFGGSPRVFQGASMMAVERDKMLAGQPAGLVRFSGVDNYGVLPAHLEGQVAAPRGACPVFVHMDFDTSEYLLFDMCINWGAPASSTLSIDPERLASRTPFIPRFEEVPQPGAATPLDAFGSNVMYRATSRAFPPGAPADVSMVINHAVLGPLNQSAVKWVQFNFNGNPPNYPNGALFVDGFENGGSALPVALSKQLFDEGTVVPDADNRWLGGIAIDRSGNIGLGYSVSGSALNPQLRTTGRTAGDPPGIMRDEQMCTPASTGAQTSTSGRWGDYSSMSVDPVDECTFWFTSEWYPVTSASTWSTRVCAFKFAECGQPTFALVADSATRVEMCTGNTPAPPTFALRVGVYDGFNTSVSFSLSGFPGAANPQFSPATLTPPGSSLLTLTGANSLPSGEYSAAVTATAGAQARSLQVQLGVSNAAAAPPVLTTPADGELDVKVRPTLTWATVPDTVTYRVEVSLSNTFATLVASDSVTTNSWVANVGLTPSTPYFWRVRADNYCGNGTFSSVRSFTTGVPGTCPAGSTLTSVFVDDIESGVNGWTTDGTGGTAWARGLGLSGTGLTTNVWRVPNNTVSSDRGLVSPAIVIPPTAVSAFASFDAFYKFENGTDAGGNDLPPGCWDGAALEAKRMADSNFTYLSAATGLINGYNGTLLAGAPLAGRDVWCRVPTPTPARSVIDLDAYTGQSIQLRFRATSDSNSGAPAPNGMSFDNIRVDACIP